MLHLVDQRIIRVPVAGDHIRLVVASKHRRTRHVVPMRMGQDNRLDRQIGDLPEFSQNICRLLR